MTYTRPPTQGSNTLTSAWLNTYLRDNFGALSDARSLSWTPTISATSISITYTLQEGRYIQLDKLVIATAHIKMNVVTNAGTGDYSIALPVDPRDPGSSVFHRLGVADMYDASATTPYQGVAVRSAASTCKIRRDAVSGFVGGAAPMTWATTDELALMLMYEAA